MFDTLDDSVFNTLETAYGRADGVVAQLRALADPDTADTALHGIHGSLYHQDQFCAATPLIIPYLLEVLTLDVPIRAEIVVLMASMLPAGRESNFVIGDVPSSDYIDDHAIATAAAINLGRPIIERLLDAEPADLRRATAWLLGNCDPCNVAPLVQRLDIEPDDDVRVALHLALAAAQHPSVAESSTGTRAADIARVLAAGSPLDDDDARAFATLLSEPPWAALHAELGLPMQVAARQLLRIGRDEPRTFELLRDAYEVFQARPPIRSPHDWIRINETDEAYQRAAADARFDTPGPVFATMLGWAAFPARNNGSLIIDYTNLDDRQRWTLDHVTVDPARGGLAAQRARLVGGYPLDQVVTLGRTTAT